MGYLGRIGNLMNLMNLMNLANLWFHFSNFLKFTNQIFSSKIVNGGGNFVLNKVTSKRGQRLFIVFVERKQPKAHKVGLRKRTHSIVNLYENFSVRHTRAKRTHQNFLNQKSSMMRLFLCDVRRWKRSIVNLCEHFSVRHTRAKRTHQNDFYICLRKRATGISSISRYFATVRRAIQYPFSLRIFINCSSVSGLRLFSLAIASCKIFLTS